MKRLLKWIFTLLPFIFLALLFPKMPEEISIPYSQSHFVLTILKIQIYILVFVVMIFACFIFPIIYKLDPSLKTPKAKATFDNLEIVIIGFFSFLSLFIIHFGYTKYFNLKYLIELLGLFFLFIGLNYKCIPQNYFIGMRTPWTLRDKTVWDQTHLLAGKVWQIAGAVIIILSLCVSGKLLLILFLILLFLLVLIPIVYSYLNFKKSKK